ncbi:MAG: ATPase, T2SS/T4P/T4SS family [Bifidobacteriaceae bacterium]|nr:ATPase, T2SS/T4P/T4SS family [Bifidobacteriaceae bacterium]
MNGDVMRRLGAGVYFGPLDAVMHEPGVTDVAVTPDGCVWVDRGDGMEEHSLVRAFGSPEQVRAFAVQLCAQMGRRLDDSHPICDAGTLDGVRLHAVIAPIVPFGASISLRLPSSRSLTLDQLQRAGMMPLAWLDVLEGLVGMRATLLVCGGTGSGKTTLLKALLRQCDARERIVTVEETRELGSLGHADCVSLVTREANIEGAGEVGLSDLVKATVRMRPDRIVLGECRGPEVTDLLRAFNSGHRGGMATIHADGVERVPARLMALGLLADVRPEAIAAMSEGAFDAVLYVKRGPDGRRWLAQIGRLETQEGANGSLRLVGRSLASWDGEGVQQYAPQWQEFCSGYLQWTARRW